MTDQSINLEREKIERETEQIRQVLGGKLVIDSSEGEYSSEEESDHEEKLTAIASPVEPFRSSVSPRLSNAGSRASSQVSRDTLILTPHTLESVQNSLSADLVTAGPSSAPDLPYQHDSQDDVEDEVHGMIPDLEPEEVLELNQNYQAFIHDMWERVQLMLAQNRERQTALRAELSVDDTTSDGRGKKTYRLYNFFKPYFRDSYGNGPPPNDDARHKRQEKSISPFVVPCKKWSQNDQKTLYAAVRSDGMQKKTQPLMSKLEIYTTKLRAGAEGANKKELQKKIQATREDINKMTRASDSELLGDRLDPHDWDKIANVDFDGSRTPMGCQLQWQNVAHPSVNQQNWTADETGRLEEIITSHGAEDWQRIAQELGTGRTAIQCLKKYQTEINRELRNSKWSPEEDAMMTELVEKLRMGDIIPYSQIAYFMEGRTISQCVHRWTKSLDPYIVKGRWNTDEDIALLTAVAKFGAKDWVKIKDFVPGRNDAQVRERYMNVLNPEIKRGDWTNQEDKQLMALYEKHGSAWSTIASEMSGRTDCMVLRRFEWLLKKKNMKYVPLERKPNAPVVPHSEETMAKFLGISVTELLKRRSERLEREEQEKEQMSIQYQQEDKKPNKEKLYRLIELYKAKKKDQTEESGVSSRPDIKPKKFHLILTRKTKGLQRDPRLDSIEAGILELLRPSPGQLSRQTTGRPRLHKTNRDVLMKKLAASAPPSKTIFTFLLKALHVDIPGALGTIKERRKQHNIITGKEKIKDQLAAQRRRQPPVMLVQVPSAVNQPCPAVQRTATALPLQQQVSTATSLVQQRFTAVGGIQVFQTPILQQMPIALSTGQPATIRAQTPVVLQAPQTTPQLNLSAARGAQAVQILKPTVVPVASPSAVPVSRPVPTSAPNVVPVACFSAAPPAGLSAIHTADLSTAASADPTDVTTAIPSAASTAGPSTTSEAGPSTVSKAATSAVPTSSPSAVPTSSPSVVPTAGPTVVSTSIPSTASTAGPSTAVSTADHSAVPTADPSVVPKASSSSCPSAASPALPSTISTAVPKGGAVSSMAKPSTALPQVVNVMLTSKPGKPGENAANIGQFLIVLPAGMTMVRPPSIVPAGQLQSVPLGGAAQSPLPTPNSTSVNTTQGTGTSINTTPQLAGTSVNTTPQRAVKTSVKTLQGTGTSVNSTKKTGTSVNATPQLAGASVSTTPQRTKKTSVKTPQGTGTSVNTKQKGGTTKCTAQGTSATDAITTQDSGMLVNTVQTTSTTVSTTEETGTTGSTPSHTAAASKSSAKSGSKHDRPEGLMNLAKVAAKVADEQRLSGRGKASTTKTSATSSPRVQKQGSKTSAPSRAVLTAQAPSSSSASPAVTAATSQVVQSTAVMSAAKTTNQRIPIVTRAPTTPTVPAIPVKLVHTPQTPRQVKVIRPARKVSKVRPLAPNVSTMNGFKSLLLGRKTLVAEMEKLQSTREARGTDWISKMLHQRPQNQGAATSPTAEGGSSPSSFSGATSPRQGRAEMPTRVTNSLVNPHRNSYCYKMLKNRFEALFLWPALLSTVSVGEKPPQTTVQKGTKRSAQPASLARHKKQKVKLGSEKGKKTIENVQTGTEADGAQPAAATSGRKRRKRPNLDIGPERTPERRSTRLAARPPIAFKRKYTRREVKEDTFEEVEGGDEDQGAPQNGSVGEGLEENTDMSGLHVEKEALLPHIVGSEETTHNNITDSQTGADNMEAGGNNESPSEKGIVGQKLLLTSSPEKGLRSAGRVVQAGHGDHSHSDNEATAYEKYDRYETGKKSSGSEELGSPSQVVTPKRKRPAEDSVMSTPPSDERRKYKKRRTIRAMLLSSESGKQ